MGDYATTLLNEVEMGPEVVDLIWPERRRRRHLGDAAPKT
jgi:hypothetical protein